MQKDYRTQEEIYQGIVNRIKMSKDGITEAESHEGARSLIGLY